HRRWVSDGSSDVGSSDRAAREGLGSELPPVAWAKTDPAPFGSFCLSSQLIAPASIDSSLGLTCPALRVCARKPITPGTPCETPRSEERRVGKEWRAGRAQ